MVLIDVVIDISHWQGPIDFAQVKDSGIVGVILKCTQGISFLDPTYAARLTQASEAGLLVGAYHFFDGADPLLQADWFLRNAGAAPVMVLDFEPVPTNAELTANAAEFCAGIAGIRGHYPVLYTGRWELAVSEPTLLACPLYLAEYGANPVPPPGFSSFILWQYTRTGRVPGVPGVCDRSRFAGTPQQLRAWWRDPRAIVPQVTSGRRRRRKRRGRRVRWRVIDWAISWAIGRPFSEAGE